MMPGGGRPAAGTILIADDDASQLRELRDFLEAAGHEVITAESGAAAVRELSAHHCDLVLSNVVLPDLDGLELCRAIKRAPATHDIPVILLSAEDDELQRERALQAGADDIAVRPVERAMVLALVRAQLRIGRLSNQLHGMEGIVVTLARAMDDRDLLSAGLAERVAHWAMQLGAEIGLSDEDLTLLYKAALLHDVGTLAIPATLLAKQGRLEPAEFNQIKQHPVVGEEILEAFPRADRLLPAVRHHHERMDGAGYPDGLQGERIPLFARIIAIADAFVAMTSDRPYRRRLSREEALRTLQQGAGRQWDASLVPPFLKVAEQPDTDAIGQMRSAS